MSFQYINSTNRISGTSSNFSYRFYIPSGKVYSKCVVLQASIPKSYYLIVNNYNNTFTLRELGLSASVSLPQGNYTRTSFVRTLTTYLNNASISLGHSWTYTITYDNINSSQDSGKLTYAVGGNSSNQPSIITDENSCYEQLGFDANTTNTFSGNTLVSSNAIKINLEDTIYIRSDIISNGIDNILQEIYTTNTSSNAAIVYQNTSPLYIKDIKPSTDNVYHFYLTNEDGKPIDLNGLNMQITLLLLN